MSVWRCNAERREEWARAAGHVALGATPVLITLFLIRQAVAGHVFALDYEHGMWSGAHSVLSGGVPYVGTHSPQLAQGSEFVYPALAAVLLAPLSLLSQGFAGAIFTVVVIAAVVLTLWLLEVRDYRVYGAVFLWPAVISGWQTANLTLLIGLGLAVAWRYRDRAVVCGCVIALLISVKVFVWPLALWLLATRRYRTFAYTTGACAVLNLVAWLIVGFSQISRYLNLMNAVTQIQERNGYSVLGLALQRGVSHAAADALAIVIATAVGAGCLALGRRGRDRSAFVLAIGVCLLATPLVWLHYFALLIVPLALARPKFGAIWLLPIVMIFPPTAPAPWQVLVALILGAVLVWRVLRSEEHSSPGFALRSPTGRATLPA